MEYFDAMDLASPFNSNPSTPKPKSRNFRTPSPPYKSNATVISLDTPPERNYDNAYDFEDPMQYNYNDNDSDATQMPDLTEYGTPANSPVRFSHANIPPLKLARQRTYARRGPDDANAVARTLDHMVLSPPTTNPSITVLLVLTPQPASLAETTAFETLGSRFCVDFGGRAGSNWSSISLYAHFRKWATQQVSDEQDPLDGSGEVGGNDVGIGGIHPYALRDKLDQEKEVQWRLAVPVLQALIEGEVKKGSRAFVVCGLRVGDVQGVRAFGRTVSSDLSILVDQCQRVNGCTD
jgi:hypothetical protein